ncbi:MAG: CBS domain-containing protein [Nitrospinales bacterium]
MEKTALTAKDIMSRQVVTIRKQDSIEDLARLFIKHEINGVPVVDETGKVVGIVTESDLIEQNKNLHIPTVITLFDAVISLDSDKKLEAEIKKLTATKVEDICNPKVITITQDMEVTELASLMADKRVHTLPVLENGQLVGIIGKLDIIKALTQS